ncbi:unnamed protein product, partial [marine sediment metagenome]
MAHGQPDFGLYAPKSTVYGQADIAELAARLGSIVTFDRRGDVIFLEDFESGVEKWGVQPLEGGAAVREWDSRYSQFGAFSCRVARTAVLGEGVEIYRYRPYSVLSQIGLEASFSVIAGVNFVSIGFVLYTGTQEIDTYIRWNNATNMLQYYSGAWAFTDIPGASFDLWPSERIFHVLKVVSNPVTGFNTRVILNNREFDLSAYPLRITDGVITSPRITIDLRFYSNQNIYT